MRRSMYTSLALALVAICMSVSWRYFWSFAGQPSISSVTVYPVSTLVLDAGHGGEDGGAVSMTGISESQINLAITLKMDQILGLYGVAPVLLRDQDISLHDAGAATLREKKVSDLKNRVAAIQSLENPTLLSIHQNSYPDGKYKGAQVFYAPTEQSQELAQHIQNALRGSLQPENTRECKPIPDTVYLMNHIDCQAVLIECGFLTNQAEEALLRDSGYQKKLAMTLSSAWLSYDDLETEDLSGLQLRENLVE